MSVRSAPRWTRCRAPSQSGPPAAFKVYTAWSPTGQGFSLEDPAIGLPTVQHAHDLGVKVFVAHKGLPLVNFDPAFNHPDDIVAVSRQFPDMDFVVYHAAWDPSHVEGPYDPSATIGIDSLLAALDRHECPSQRQRLGRPRRRCGASCSPNPTRPRTPWASCSAGWASSGCMWGTDAIWYGSPQPQIMAMRAFQITAEFQDTTATRPSPTSEGGSLRAERREPLRHRPDGHPLRPTPDPLTANIEETAQLRSEGALPSAWTPNGPTTRRQVLNWLASSKTGWSPS